MAARACGAEQALVRDQGWRTAEDIERLRQLAIPWLRANPHAIPADREGQATVIAKAIAESSCNEAHTIRARPP